MLLDLFESLPLQRSDPEPIYPDAWLLRGYLGENSDAVLTELELVLQHAPLRQMVTPGGYRMSVHTSSCGDLGWVSDARGYRYAAQDPESGQPWPRMPDLFRDLARDAAAAVGFHGFEPDACLINVYAPGAKMGLHQDRDERDLSQPIVSVSLGLPAIFQMGGFTRRERPLRIPLQHGDLVVWGGQARMRYHGVAPVKIGEHSRLGAQRINLTFRCAG